MTTNRHSAPSSLLPTERLKELEEIGVIQRCTESRDIRYYLTDVGNGIEPVLAAVESWSRELSAIAPLSDA